MKNLLFTFISATILLISCNTEKKDSLNTDKRLVFSDTSLMKSSNLSTDKALQGENEPVVAQEEKREAPKTQIRTITKIIRVVEKQPTPAPIANPATTTTPQAETPAPAQTGSNTSNNDVTVKTPEETVQKKKGWSDAAKGATIGGVGGAVAGAVISKNKGKGAIIGGVIGAAGGYILGRKADKKSGRAQVATP
jgi:hypothetical protein